MSDLAKLVSDIRGLTEAETTELVGLLGERWHTSVPSAQNRLADGLIDLSEEDWLVAEAISLKAEAAALARSLDETLDDVRARCDAVLEGT